VDRETTYKVVLDENRHLTELVAPLTSSSPPLPPPVPEQPPAPAEVG
jgi:hypothetical protein